MSSISRKLAYLALLEFEKTHRRPDDILDRLFAPEITGRDRNLAWELTMGSIRYLKRLDFIAQSYIDAPLSKQKPEIISVLRLGLYQLTRTDGIPEFAAVDETVSVAGEEISAKAAGFVNAVLRNFLREPDRVKFPRIDKDPAAGLSNKHSYPEWMVRRWLKRFGADETEEILKAFNHRPGISLKILCGRTDREALMESLHGEGIEVTPGRFLPDFIISQDQGAVLQSSPFRAGRVIVQDESQGLPLHLLDPPESAVALDLCAAPGGKTLALADRVGESGRVVSVDINPGRLRQLEENIGRTGFGNINIVESDLLEFASPEKFRYILLDAPCSDLGTMSVHPDLKWSKTEKDIEKLSRLQSRLLNRAATFLADGGTLVYSTCTTEPEEIEDVVEGLIDSRPDFHLEDGNYSFLEAFKTGTGIYRSWPHKHGIGGGGFARLRKR